MQIETCAIPDVLLVRPKKIADSRGFFSETYKHAALQEAGIDVAFIQDNHSLSVAAGTVRGLHFQIPPFAQSKLIRVTRGRIFDVAVDLRNGSPTYGAYVAAELSAANWMQLYIPAGFAHGFMTLEAETEVHYKVCAPYAASHETGILWNDPALAIDWPAIEPHLSAKDQLLPRFAEFSSPFEYRA